MRRRTLFLGRLIGLYCLAISLAMGVHKAAMVQTVTSFMHNPPLLFLAGVIGIAVGLAIVIGHNVWSGGALPVTITLVGWLALIKGSLLLFLPQDAAQSVFLQGLHYERWYYGYTAVTFLIGLFMVYGSLRTRRLS
jgi:hypothetical protein